MREGVPVKGSVTRVQEGCAEKAPEEPRGGWVMDPRSSDPTVTPGPSPTSSLENPKFPGILARLEESPVCQRLPLTSFLILPFQRITRLKMLVEVPAGHRLQEMPLGTSTAPSGRAPMGGQGHGGEAMACCIEPTPPSRTF